MSSGYINTSPLSFDKPPTNLEAGPSYLSVHIRSLFRLHLFISNHAVPNFAMEIEQLIRDCR